MLLAEALVERADAQKRLADLKRRIADNARVTEGDEPSEDPLALLREAERTVGRVHELLVAVNVTNAAVRLPGGQTVTAALGRRDELGTRIRLLADAAERASARQLRFGRAELREQPVLDVQSLREEIDRLAAERRDLDLELQKVNWTTELTGVE